MITVKELNSKIQAVLPVEKIRKITVEEGLYVEVHPKDPEILKAQPTAGQYWRWKYRFAGKEKRLSIGTYADFTLKQARDIRDNAKLQLRQGVDPSVAKRVKAETIIEDSQNTFKVVATAWLELRALKKRDDHETLRRLEHDVYPKIGHIGMNAIRSTMIDELVLQPMIRRGVYESVRRVLSLIRRVFEYAEAKGICANISNPAIGLKQVLPDVERGHFAAITDPDRAGELLRQIDGYKGTFITITALKLAALLALRPANIRFAEWREFDLEKGYMFINAEDMKLNEPLIVPLADQALALLKDLHYVTGDGQYLFPSRSNINDVISPDTMRAALNRLGFKGEQTAHGFRTTFRTLGDEQLNIRPDFLDHQLAHAVKDPNGRSYNRTTFLMARKQMMQTWADYLDDLRSGRVDRFPRLI